MSYSERLRVPSWWMLLGALFVASIAIAVFAYLEPWLAVTVITLSLLAVGLGIFAYGRTQLSVDREAFTAGRYRLEHAYIGEVTPYEGAAAREVMGPAADHRAFLFTRPYIVDVVRIDLVDPADPHSCWMVSTRRAQQLAKALSEGATR